MIDMFYARSWVGIVAPIISLIVLLLIIWIKG